MVSTRHTQSLTDFRAKATETLDRINKSGEAEVLTVNGQARAVLMAPAAYDELMRQAMLDEDVAVIRQSLKEIEEGKVQEVREFGRELRAKLLKMKARRGKTASK